MKKMIATACAAIASAVALASTVQSSNTFGVLKVDTGNTSGVAKQYFIGVPWENVGGGSVSPTNLVLATGLTEGSALYYYDNGDDKNFKAWKIVSGAWTSAQVVSDGVTYPAAGAAVVSRGSGLVIETPNTYVYLSGQHNPDSAVAPISGASSAGVEAYTLIGNTLGTPANITIEHPKTGDMLFVDGAVYKYDGSSWTVPPTSLPSENAFVTTWTPVGSLRIAAGRGAWYVTTTTDTDRSASFSAAE